MTERIEHTIEPNDTRKLRATAAGPYFVSTVRLLLESDEQARVLGGRFETMVFDLPSGRNEPKDWNELDSERYETREQALAGHEKAVAKWQEKADSVP
jgi:hypothetical protein